MQNDVVECPTKFSILNTYVLTQEINFTFTVMHKFLLSMDGDFNSQMYVL